MVRESMEKYQKSKKRKIETLSALIRKTAECFGMSEKTIKNIIQDYEENNNTYKTIRIGNKTNHQTKLPRTQDFRELVSGFVNLKRQKTEPITGTELKVHLSERGYFSDTETSARSKTRNLQRYLKSSGFLRGDLPKTSENPILIKKRIEYLSWMEQNRSAQNEEQYREVYLDESYIHAFHHHLSQSLYDPNLIPDNCKKPRNKGQRLCFIAAIVGEKPNINPENADEGDFAHILSDTILIFEAKKTNRGLSWKFQW